MTARRITLRISFRSDAGLERPRNEDNYCYVEGNETALLAVADGMGGHVGGDVASYLAVKTLLDLFCSEYNDAFQDANILPYIEKIVKKANREIYQTALQEPEKMGMGTTLTMGMIRERVFYWGHVGDSRAYLIHQNFLEQITRDHSLVEEMVSKGKITPREARFHPQRNVLTRVLGTSQHVNVDLGKLELAENNDLLLCTDGLTSLLDEDEIHQVIMNYRENPEEVATYLIDMANSRGGSDNITLIYAIEAGRKRTS